MGSNPYCYFAPYEADIHSALQKLRLREFEAGRYDPALQAATPPTWTFRQDFPPGPDFPHPGAQHASLDAAIAAMGESGTGSILDIVAISSTPMPSCATARAARDLMEIFGTTRPTRSDVGVVIVREAELPVLTEERQEKLDQFWDPIERGHACFVTVYDRAVPSELFFAGMTID